MTKDAVSDAAGVLVDEATYQRLVIFQKLAEKWNPRINLVSRNTLPDFWTRHVLDSAQLYRFLPLDAQLCVDLGSGGGLPGLVLAILGAQMAPDRQHVLIESDQRKAVFLREVVRETGCKAIVRTERIEETPPVGADALTARALAPLPMLLGFAFRHLRPGGIAILPKGAAFQEELTAASDHWQFTLEVYPSITDPDGHVLRISNLRQRAMDR